MKVIIDKKNKQLETVYSKEYDFIEYCELMNKKILGILYKVDDFDNGDISYKNLKKYIFDVAGSVKRIPDNIKGE